MNPTNFDLNDIENEPSDEQLASLMEAVAVKVRQRAIITRSELLARLRAELARTAAVETVLSMSKNRE